MDQRTDKMSLTHISSALLETIGVQTYKWEALQYLFDAKIEKEQGPITIFGDKYSVSFVTQKISSHIYQKHIRKFIDEFTKVGLKNGEWYITKEDWKKIVEYEPKYKLEECLFEAEDDEVSAMAILQRNGYHYYKEYSKKQMMEIHTQCEWDYYVTPATQVYESEDKTKYLLFYTWTVPNKEFTNYPLPKRSIKCIDVTSAIVANKE